MHIDLSTIEHMHKDLSNIEHMYIDLSIRAHVNRASYHRMHTYNYYISNYY